MPYSMPLAISPRNHGPENTMPALPSLNSEVISAEEGSAGRMPSLLIHLSRCSMDFTFGAELTVGLSFASNTPPPKPFISAAW
jgi:hypothetical protein